MEKSGKGIHVTQTAQSRSVAQLSEDEKNLTINASKSEKEKQIRLMLTLSDSLKELYENLNNLSNLSRIMERELKNVN